MIEQHSHELTYEGLQRSAEHVISHMEKTLHVTLHYNLASVQWLDGYIERNRTQISGEMFDSVVRLFGAYLGACIVHEYRGVWMRSEINRQWVIRVGIDGLVNPFAQVENHLKNGAVDSIARFYSQIPARYSVRWYHGV